MKVCGPQCGSNADAPIGRHAAEQAGRSERVEAQRVLLVEPECLVAGQFEKEHVVDHRVGADAADMRGKSAFDDRLGAGRGRKRRAGKGERPRRRRVPRILNGRIIVGGDAVDEVEPADICGAGKAKIGIVPGPGVQELVCRIAGQTGYRAWRVIGDLDEGAEIAGDRAAPEPAERATARCCRSPCRGRSAARSRRLACG